MATESIGRMVRLTDEMADRMIEQIERFEKQPPKPNAFEIKWADPKRFAAALEKKYSDDK